MNAELATIPAEVSALWQRAIKANCRAAKTALFYKWLEAGSDRARKLGCIIVMSCASCLFQVVAIQLLDMHVIVRLHVRQERSREDIARGKHKMGTALNDE